jgi:hypothetical protein
MREQTACRAAKSLVSVQTFRETLGRTVVTCNGEFEGRGEGEIRPRGSRREECKASPRGGGAPRLFSLSWTWTSELRQMNAERSEGSASTGGHLALAVGGMEEGKHSDVDSGF